MSVERMDRLRETGFSPQMRDVEIVEHRAKLDKVRHDIAGIDQYRLMTAAPEVNTQDLAGG